MADVVTCHLCGRVWQAATRAGSSAYQTHYRLHHYTLETERSTRR